jgi:hypothetical protein
MPYCINCGKQVDSNTKFCWNCGTPLESSAAQPQNLATQTSIPLPPPPPPPETQPQQSNSVETVIGVLLLMHPKSLGRYDTYCGVVTNQRLIFAQISGQMVSQATLAAKEQAKAEGKGFWGQWKEQLKASMGISKKYLTMQPSAILAETPGNFAFGNNTISELKIKLKDKGSDDDVSIHEFELIVNSSSGNVSFRMEEDSDYVALLRSVYADRVKTPFGYFSKSIKIG